MEERRFDELTKALSKTRGRRSFLKAALAASSAVVASAAGAGSVAARGGPPTPQKICGQWCRQTYTKYARTLCILTSQVHKGPCYDCGGPEYTGADICGGQCFDSGTSCCLDDNTGQLGSNCGSTCYDSGTSCCLDDNTGQLGSNCGSTCFDSATSCCLDDSSGQLGQSCGDTCYDPNTSCCADSGTSTVGTYCANLSMCITPDQCCVDSDCTSRGYGYCNAGTCWY